MTRRRLLTGAAAVAGAPMVNFGSCRLFGSAGKTYSTRVVDLVARSLVIDMLGLLTMDWDKLDRWQDRPSNFRPEDFEDIRRSGVNTVHPAVDLNAKDAYADTLRWMRRWKAFIEEHPAQFRAVRAANDIGLAKASGQIGIVMGMQNSEHFRAPADVFLFHEEGQRISQLTYNLGNRLGSGCVDRSDTGLSQFGADVILAMNHIGMVVDVSHASERTTLEAIEASRKPILITHSNCRALVQHPRCKSDAVIRAMAAKGGVMGITGVRAFVAARGKATIDDVLDHFKHVARLVGVEHIGIGSDAGIDGAPSSPHLDVQGFNQPSRIFDLTEGLLRRGFSVNAISQILGGNFKRALGDILDA